MESTDQETVILVADDDEDDCLLIKEAILDAGLAGKVHFVYDGTELMDYLHSCVEKEAASAEAYPDLILLDLNMPRKDGREALRELKGIPKLKTIPVVVLTTSDEKRDIELCRELGAASFITKPMRYDDWIDIMKAVYKHIFPKSGRT